MQKKFSIYYLLFIALAFSSCIKKEVTPLGDEGKTFIKILEGPENKVFLSPYSGVKAVPIYSVRRDANSNASLQTTAPITLTRIDAMVTRYNAENGTDYEILPDSLYTLPSYIAKSGNTYTFDMVAGDFSKEFSINLNGSKWDLSHKYALGFALTSVGSNNAKSDGRDSVVALISVKNKYDGVYKVTGTMLDVSNALFVGTYPLEWELQTTGTSSCVVVDNVQLGIPGHVFNSAGGTSPNTYYGSYGLVVNFDLATDAISSVVNYYGQPASNTRSAALDPSGANRYTASSKTIDIKYYMIQPSVIPTPPSIRVYFNEQWSYLRGR
jgi:hypothetical protein